MPPVDIPDVSLVKGGVVGCLHPELLLVLPASVVEPSWMCCPGQAPSSVNKVSTLPVPFRLDVEDPVQPPERREGRSHCLPR